MGARSQKYGAALSKGSTQKYNLGKLRAERTFERISQKYNREIVLSNGGGGGLKSRTGGRWPGPSDASGAGVAARPFQRAPGRCAQKYTQKYTQRAHETIGPFLLSLMLTGKKNAKSKTQTGTKARERAFFGAATPVRARGHGFREWGGNSNLKRNLSPSESDGLRFPLKIQLWVLWR